MKYVLFNKDQSQIMYRIQQFELLSLSVELFFRLSDSRESELSILPKNDLCLKLVLLILG